MTGLSPEYRIPYGRGSLAFTLPEGIHADWLAPADSPGASDPLATVSAALEKPLGGGRLVDFAGARTAAVAINDNTRPVPHRYLLPPLLATLESLGIPPQAITLVVATGAHGAMTPDAFPEVVPAGTLGRYPVVSHDCDDEGGLVDLGSTERGTPVKINRHFYKADLRITVGNIEPHQFAGFSGGVKTAAIGLGGRAGISHNHALMMLPESRIGAHLTNPVRLDIEAMGARIGVHFSLNTILNSRKEIVHALFGEPAAVMGAGVPLSRQVCQVTVSDRYDLLVVSPGGHPKDINVYQAQKALGHASLIVREGGTVILAAACPEGSGSERYEAWMAQGIRSHDDVLARFKREGFRIGPHKAFQIARDASRVKLRWMSDMKPEVVRFLLLDPIDDLQAAVNEAVAGLPSSARVGVMPFAHATIPVLNH